MRYFFMVCVLGLSLTLYADSAEESYTEIRDNADQTNDDHYDASESDLFIVKSYREIRDAYQLSAPFLMIGHNEKRKE